ncbi:hypothetical protein H1C71_007748, partial [Ictidomys tridecemlineatus]
RLLGARRGFPGVRRVPSPAARHLGAESELSPRDRPPERHVHGVEKGVARWRPRRPGRLVAGGLAAGGRSLEGLAAQQIHAPGRRQPEPDLGPSPHRSPGSDRSPRCPVPSPGDGGPAAVGDQLAGPSLLSPSARWEWGMPPCSCLDESPMAAATSQHKFRTLKGPQMIPSKTWGLPEFPPPAPKPPQPSAPAPSSSSRASSSVSQTV